MSRDLVSAQIDELVASQILAISSALSRSNLTHISGAKLHALIKDTVPTLDIRALVGIPSGPGALTQFVDMFLVGIVSPDGKAGGDVLYRITSQPDDKRTESRSRGETHGTSDTWKTFISPRSPHALIYNQEHTQIETKPKQSLSPLDNIIPSVTSDEHAQIRRDFQHTLDGPDLQRLGDIDLDSKTFDDWIKHIKAAGPSVYDRWGKFRRTRLLSMFFERIDDLEIDEASQNALRTQVQQSLKRSDEEHRSKLAEQRAVNGPIGTARFASAELGTVNHLNAARQIAHRVVDAMDYEELRSLRVPLGSVIDALARDV